MVTATSNIALLTTGVSDQAKKLKYDTPTAKKGRFEVASTMTQSPSWIYHVFDKSVIFEVASAMTQSPSIWTNYPWLVIASTKNDF